MSTITLVEIETRSGWRHFTDTGGIVIGTTPYAPRLIGNGGYFRHLFAPAATLGPGGAEAKPVVLANADRALDGLHRAVDGRQIVVRQGDRLAGGWASGDIDDYPPVFRGRIQTAQFAGDTVEMVILSRQEAISETLLMDRRFDGTATSGGAGIGGNDELAGQPFPVLVGTAFNFAPPFANAFDQVMQISAGWPGHTVAIGQVLDRGVALTPGTGHATLALLLAASPASGVYDWHSGTDGTFIKLGAAPDGTVTVTATEGGGRTVASCAAFLLGLADSGPVNGAATLAARASGPAGIWIGPEDTTIGTALERVLSGVGWWVDDLNDESVTVGYWDAPQTPVQSIAAWEVLDPGIELLSSNDAGGGSPIREMLIGYRRNHQVLEKSALDAAVASNVASLLAQEYSLAERGDPTVLLENPLAETLRVDTSLAILPDAQGIANHQFALRRTGIDIYRVPMATSRVRADIGQSVTLTNPRFGLAGGAVCGVLGRDTTGRRIDGISTTDLILWRPTP